MGTGFRIVEQRKVLKHSQSVSVCHNTVVARGVAAGGKPGEMGEIESEECIPPSEA